MPYLSLESATEGVVNLNEVLDKDYGLEAIVGVTGLGLPPVVVQWLEGAGDGATYQGGRVLPRDIDLPLYVRAKDRPDLQGALSRIARMMAGKMTLRFNEDDGETSWAVDVYRVGGGQYVYGKDTTGERDLVTTLTVRAGEPFWEYSEEKQKTLSAANQDHGLLFGAGSLVALDIAPSQFSGSVTIENEFADVHSAPVWEITGPATAVSASSGGKSWSWSGILGDGEKLFIHSKDATVIDGSGVNRYSELGVAPKFWPIAPGLATATVAMTGTGEVKVTWRPRKWAII